MKRLLITGSRAWDDQKAMKQALTDAYIHLVGSDPSNWTTFVTLVHGRAAGADQMAGAIWKRYALGPVEEHPADWNKYGKRAGFLRNKEMVDLGADLCVAFQVDKSKGTQHTIDLARAAGIDTWVIEG